MTRDVLIVGAGLAGSRCAEALRAEGFSGRVVVVGDESEPPYERPALSKEFLAGREAIALRPASFWKERGIELLLGAPVAGLDTGSRLARVGAEVLRWDALVLATGARPREPFARTSHLHVLRTAADARRLRVRLGPGTRLAVVGAGFLGAEVASTATALGARVTLVEAGTVPFEGAFGPEVGRLLAARWRAHRVDLRTGVSVAAARARELELSDGSTVAFDEALVAVGVVPAAELVPGLRAADGGIAVDACGRTAVPGVYACGDVATVDGRRVEHWTSAAGQALAVARAVAGRPEPYADPPYFWSDQFGIRLQHVGATRGWTRIELDADATSFSARYLAADGRLAGALVANRPHEVASLRRELAALPWAA